MRAVWVVGPIDFQDIRFFLVRDYIQPTLTQRDLFDLYSVLSKKVLHFCLGNRISALCLCVQPFRESGFFHLLLLDSRYLGNHGLKLGWSSLVLF